MFAKESYVGCSRKFACIALAFALSFSGSAAAQNRAHPGLVHIDKGVWVTPAEAQAKGFVRYRERWVPEKLQKNLRTWEAQDAKDVAKGVPYKVRSKHYRITTDVPRYVVHLDIVPFLDELFPVYTKYFREDFGLRGKGADSHFLKIYGSFERFHEVEKADRSAPAYIAGDELVTFYEETDPGEFYNSIFHEGAHQFFAALLPGAELPIWLDEALATYFEGFTYSRARGEIVPNPVSRERLECAQELLREAQAMSQSLRPEDLFMSYEGDAFTAEHYSLAWSFVHYLIHREGGKHRQDFGKFLAEMNGSGTKPVAEVFEIATKKKLADVVSGWAAHVLALPLDTPVEWVFASFAGGGELGAENGDVVWSLDDIEIHGGEQLEKLWSARPKDRDCKLRLVRRSGEGVDYTTRFVEVTVPAGSALELEVSATLTRTSNLVD